MSSYIRKNAFAILCTLALVVAGIASADAQTEEPIFDEEEDIVACVHIGDLYHVVPVAHAPALETFYGVTPTIESVVDFVANLPFANSSITVRIEGASLAPSIDIALCERGYFLRDPIDPTLIPGTLTGVLCTD